ncbi:hypothetical protein GLYMA_09G140450v4 [Glycine max]|nr:hypothetical protein GLYMA_09G140450v4 [Glycine max]KAH1042972.1 hypothetical protein GYH30_025015 [Glycine max]
MFVISSQEPIFSIKKLLKKKLLDWLCQAFSFRFKFKQYHMKDPCTIFYTKTCYKNIVTNEEFNSLCTKPGVKGSNMKQGFAQLCLLRGIFTLPNVCFLKKNLQNKKLLGLLF